MTQFILLFEKMIQFDDALEYCRLFGWISLYKGTPNFEEDKVMLSMAKSA